MKCDFDDWMFITGAASTCYTLTSSRVLSQGDKAGAAVYPRASGDISAAVKNARDGVARPDQGQGIAPRPKIRFQQQLEGIKSQSARFDPKACGRPCAAAQRIESSTISAGRLPPAVLECLS